MDTAVAENGEFFPQADLGDADVGNIVWFLGSIKDGCQGGKDCIIVMSIGTELSDCLSNEHIEPV